MLVREAVLDDAEGIARVDVDSHAAAYADLLPADYLAQNTLEGSIARWKRVLQGEGDPDLSPEMVLVAVEGDEVLGYARLLKSRDADGEGVGEIGAIYVAPERWRQGVGQALMTASLVHLKSQGFPEATLWVLEANERARAFYEKEGWHLDGGRQTNERGGIETAEVRYRRSL